MKNHVNLSAFERIARATYHSLTDQIPSKNQVKLWRQTAEICAHQMSIESSENSRFQVISHKTGTGKTHAIIALAADISRCNREIKDQTPTRLTIAVRERTQADEMANEINKIADNLVATAHYSGQYEKREDFEQFDVFIVTHKGIANGLECLMDDTLLQSHHSYLYTHTDLIVFDEAPEELFRVKQVPLDQLRHLRAFSTLLKAGEHTKAIQYIDQLATFGEKQQPNEDRLLWTTEADCPISPISHEEITGFLQAYNEEAKKDAGCFQSIEDDRTALDIANLTKTWMTLRNDKDSTSFETAKFIWPKGLKKPVVLDATAELSQIWNQMGSEVNLVRSIVEARRYDAVTLHIAREHNLGKSCSSGKFSDRIARAATYFAQHNSVENTLVISHKDRHSKVTSTLSKKKGYHYANWFGLDGKNDWVDCTRAFIASLPYSPPHLAKLTARAINTPSSVNDPLLADLGRLKTQEMAGRLVQAINRTGCRRLVDDEGHCVNTDIYLLLPPCAEGDEILEILEEQMPGVHIAEWKLPKSHDSGGKMAPRYLQFLRLIKKHPRGTYTTKELASQLGWTNEQVRKLHKVLKTPSHWLCGYLREVGIKTTQKGQGRGSQWHLQVP